MQLWLYCHGTDDPLFREPIVRALLAEGVECHPGEVGDPPSFGLILFDQADPELFDLVRYSCREGMCRVVAVGLTGVKLPAATRWKLIQAGAADAFAWDDSAQPAAALAARLKRWAAVDELLESPLVRDNLVGAGAAWCSTLRQVVEVARFTDASVLLVGESGTGKELVARLIHSLDARPKKGQLVLLDCTTVVPALSGSKFFGHERGAFTSAIAARNYGGGGEGPAKMHSSRGSVVLHENGGEPLRLLQPGTVNRLHPAGRLLYITGRFIHAGGQPAPQRHSS